MWLSVLTYLEKCKSRRSNLTRSCNDRKCLLGYMQILVFSHIFLPKFKTEAEVPENLRATSNPDIRSHVRFPNFSISVEQTEMKAV